MLKCLNYLRCLVAFNVALLVSFSLVYFFYIGYNPKDVYMILTIGCISFAQILMIAPAYMEGLKYWIATKSISKTTSGNVSTFYSSIDKYMPDAEIKQKWDTIANTTNIEIKNDPNPKP